MTNQNEAISRNSNKQQHVVKQDPLKKGIDLINSGLSTIHPYLETLNESDHEWLTIELTKIAQSFFELEDILNAKKFKK
jgi:hypothetical protein